MSAFISLVLNTHAYVTIGLVDNGIKKMDWKSVRGYLSVVSFDLRPN